jgi:competence protein ComGC
MSTTTKCALLTGLFGLLLAIALPNFVKARSHSSKNACMANLKQIEGAKATWALEYQQPPTAIPTEADLAGPDRYMRIMSECPQGGVYRLGAVGEKPTCSLASSKPGHTLDPLADRASPRGAITWLKSSAQLDL